MYDLIWQKPGVAVDARIQAFLAGDDVVLDREFFLHDIAASRVNAEGLQRNGILSTEERAGIVRELDAPADDFRGGGVVLSSEERRVGKEIGSRGRSRGSTSTYKKKHTINTS